MTPEEAEDLRRMGEDEFRILMFANLKEIKGSVDRGAASAATAAAEAKRTNGRVTRLELWRAGIVGAIGVITFGTPIILFAAGKLLE